MKKQLLALLTAAVIFSACEKGNTSEVNGAVGETTSASETVSEQAEQPKQTEASAKSAKKDENIMVENGIEYTVFDGKATLKSYIGGGTSVEIPDEIGGCPVKTIVSNFFKNSGVTEVTLPKSMNEVLSSLYIGDIKIINLTSADEFKFSSIRNRASIEAVNILNESKYKSADGVVYTADGKKLVYYPPARTNAFEIPSDVEEIDEWAFSQCRISGLTMNEGLVYIGKYAFSQCRGLDSVATPFSLRKIDDYAFSGSGLREIRIRNGLESIGAGAFSSTEITELYLPDSVVKCGVSIFNVEDNGVYISAGFPTEGMVRLGSDYRNVDFRNETMLQKAVRKAGSIGEYSAGRIFLDLNFDSFPEEIVCGNYYNSLYKFNGISWEYVSDIGSKLYLYRDNKSGESFYFYMGYSEYDGSDMAMKLKLYGNNKFVSEYLGSPDYHRCSKCGRTISIQHINGVFEIGEFDGYTEETAEAFFRETDEFFYSTIEKGLAEYTLEKVIDIGAMTENIDTSQKFEIVNEKFADEPKSNGLPKYTDEDDSRNFWQPNYQAHLSADEINEEAFAKLAENPKITCLTLSGWNENAEEPVMDFTGISKLENLKELSIYGSERCRFVNTDEIGRLKGLEVLYVSSELGNYDFLAELDNLKVIEFDSTVDKPADFFKPLYGMKNLRFMPVSCWDINITDEQLAELEKNMPQLCICYYKVG